MDEAQILQAGYRYALSLTRDPAAAEDLAQQGCLRLYRRYGGLRNRSALLTTVRRLFIDDYRHRRRYELVALEELDEEPDEVQMPKLDRLDLERRLSLLRTKEREVLYLHAVEGYTATEIGELTGQGRGTVLSLIQRARRKLAAGAGRRAENG